MADDNLDDKVTDQDVLVNSFASYEPAIGNIDNVLAPVRVEDIDRSIPFTYPRRLLGENGPYFEVDGTFEIY
jgi:hypothetical protein